MSKLNEKLKTLMSNQEWTQKKLADRMFVSPDAVSSWVRGVNHPSLETVKQFCEIFWVPIQELTDDDVDIWKLEHYYEEYISNPKLAPNVTRIEKPNYRPSKRKQ